MQVSACPDYGTLKGTVRTVAPDAPPSASNEREHPPHTSYEVIIQPQTRFWEMKIASVVFNPVWRVELILFRARRQYSSSFSERQGY